MPLELLREISKRKLPLILTNVSDIDKVRILRAAGHVAAFLPAVSAQDQPVHILAITQEGWQALKAYEEAMTADIAQGETAP